MLADEINRTPPKTQSALLEAMQERQVTVEGETFALPAPFHVLAIIHQTRRLPSVELGGSPRAAVHLLTAAKAMARLRGRDFVTPDDVVEVAAPVLRHRLLLTPDAELERYTADDAVKAALAAVEVPR